MTRTAMMLASYAAAILSAHPVTRQEAEELAEMQLAKQPPETDWTPPAENRQQRRARQRREAKGHRQ